MDQSSSALSNEGASGKEADAVPVNPTLDEHNSTTLDEHNSTTLDETTNEKPPQKKQGIFGLVQKIMRVLVIYWIVTSVGSYFINHAINFDANTSHSSGNTNGDVPPTVANPKHNVVLPNQLRPLFPRGQELWMSAYLSTEPNIHSFASVKPVWTEKHIYADSSASNERIKELHLNEDSGELLRPLYRALVSNDTVYLHMFLAKRNAAIDPADPRYSELSVIKRRWPLNQYRRIKRVELRNLLETNREEGSETERLEKEEEKKEEIEIGSYWNPNITVQIVDFFEPIQTSSMPQQFLDQITVAKKRPSHYYPFVYFNDFWTLKQDMLLLNKTVQDIPIRLEFGSLGSFKWQIYQQMEMSLQIQKTLGSMSDNEDDEFKRMFIETNPWLLGLTIIVSISHSVLEMLAFKNDISHWKEMRSLEGMSIKTLMTNSIFQLVILLYLIDNETSWLVIGSTFVGLLIELWKFNKAVILRKKTTFPYFTWENRETYTTSKTKEYDDIAIRYVSYVAFPLLVAYAAYSVVYESHKSWYSFILNSSVGCIYMFGFIMMVPQLYINYRLKSVAHLPLRAFAYKAVNTFIDDLFSFIIKMPTLHRLACFRDDIIFFIYLYQRWIYPVDKARVNEFGFSGEEDKKDSAASSNDEEQISDKTSKPKQL